MPLWHGSIYIQERMRTIYNFTSVLRGMKMVSIDNAANTLRFECESNWTSGSFFVWSEFSLFILSE